MTLIRHPLKPLLERILEHWERGRKMQHWVRWLRRLHRSVKLLEGEVATGRHWTEGRRRRKEVGEILGCGKMRKMWWN
jgi:hypothetical protein